MTKTPETDPDAALNAALNDALSNARKAPPAPGADLLARVEADGLVAQAAHLRPAPSPKAAFGFRLWPQVSALAASLVLGIGLGAQFDAELLTLSGFQAGSDLVETVLWSVDLALAEEF